MLNSSQRWGYGLPNQTGAFTVPSARPETAAGHPWLSNVRGDVVGGFAAAMLTIPVSMGYGLLALSGLGPSMSAQGILAGLYAPVIGCIIAVLLGANTTMIYSPRSIVTFLIGSIVFSGLAQSKLPFVQAASPQTMLALVFLLILLAGMFQTLFGVMRLGSLVKYVPAPVIAGFANAAAILIMLSQLGSLLGFRERVEVWNIPFHLGQVQVLSVFVGVLTSSLILNGARITKRVPPTILGLAGGVAAYYLIVLAGFGSQVGPVMGAIPFSWPNPHYFAEFAGLVTRPGFWSVAPALLSGALSLALIASLDGMLCARLVEADSGNRIQNNRELVRLGVGNMVAAGFGGIANGINLGSSFANHRTGARTPLSVLVHALVILLAILLVSPLIGYLPRVVIAGMLMVVGIQLVDRWTVAMCGRLVKGQFSNPRTVAIDLLVILVVAVAAVVVNVVVAVGIGIGVTVLFFLLSMSKSVVRRSYRCDTVRSRRTRAQAQEEILRANGASIMVFELDGPIFFGTAENLAADVEAALKQPTSHVILDLKRVSEIDSTGAKILLQIHDRLKHEQVTMLVSSLEQGTRLANFLADMGLVKALTSEHLFHDADRAIQRAEEQLLANSSAETAEGAETELGEFGMLSDLASDELAILRQAVERRKYAKGEAVFSEDDKGRDLYLIANGSASVYLRLPGAKRDARLTTFSAGTAFGELALLDSQARSATVKADTELVCFVLPHSVFESLAEHDPAIAMKVLAGIGRELANRLRYASRTIYQLAS
jgi:sulfate permease, SulP family